APPPSDGQTRKSLDPGRSIRILPLDLKRIWLKALRTLGALALVLLPTHVPRWLDAEAPVAEPLTVVRGTIARHSPLASALEALLSPAGVHRLVEAARPVYDLARLSVGRPLDRKSTRLNSSHEWIS